jgi:hypothetical protein
MWFYSQPFEKLCSPACHAARGKEEAKNVQNYVLLPVMQHITRRKRKMCKTMFSCVPCSTWRGGSEKCSKLCSPTCHAARGKEEENDDHGENDEDDESGLTKLRQQVNVVLIS